MRPVNPEEHVPAAYERHHIYEFPISRRQSNGKAKMSNQGVVAKFPSGHTHLNSGPLDRGGNGYPLSFLRVFRVACSTQVILDVKGSAVMWGVGSPCFCPLGRERDLSSSAVEGKTSEKQTQGQMTRNPPQGQSWR